MEEIITTILVGLFVGLILMVIANHFKTKKSKKGNVIMSKSDNQSVGNQSAGRDIHNTQGNTTINNNQFDPQTKEDHAPKIEDEIHQNYQIIKNMKDTRLPVIKIDEDLEVSVAVANSAVAVHVKADVWNLLLPTIPIELSRKYEKIYLWTNAIANDSSDSKTPIPVKEVMLFSNAGSFIKEYEKLF